MRVHFAMQILETCNFSIIHFALGCISQLQFAMRAFRIYQFPYSSSWFCRYLKLQKTLIISVELGTRHIFVAALRVAASCCFFDASRTLRCFSSCHRRFASCVILFQRRHEKYFRVINFHMFWFFKSFQNLYKRGEFVDFAVQ